MSLRRITIGSGIILLVLRSLNTWRKLLIPALGLRSTVTWRRFVIPHSGIIPVGLRSLITWRRLILLKLRHVISRSGVSLMGLVRRVMTLRKFVMPALSLRSATTWRRFMPALGRHRMITGSGIILVGLRCVMTLRRFHMPALGLQCVTTRIPAELEASKNTTPHCRSIIWANR